MFGSPLIVAVIVAVVAMAASGWWFGMHRRQKAESNAGVTALAAMKWRECAGLVLQAMESKGYREAPASRQPGDGGAEFLLVKGDERVLLSYKHGTAYRLGEANVRDFANAVQLQGATSGVLVTLGTAEGFARDIARRFGVELIDGRSLWPQVEPFAPAAMVEEIRGYAAGEIRRGQRIGLAASAGLGVLVFLVGLALTREPAPTTPAVAGAVPATGAATSDPATGGPAAAAAPALDPDDPLRAEAEASRQASAALQELDEIEQLSDQDKLQRRLEAAAKISELETAGTAIWSTSSTLVIGMESADAVERGLVEDACAILQNYEELRYSRLQLEAPASATAGPPRWKQCQ